MTDAVNHPSHYTSGPSCPNCAATVECITITERKSFNVGNAIKYLWRAGLKGDKHKQMEDLRKAAWYCLREADRLEVES